MTSEAPNHTPPVFSHETQRLAHSCPYDTLSYGTNHPPIASSQRWHLWWLKYAQMNRRGDGLVNGNKSTQPFELYQILIRDNTMFLWTFALAPPKPANTASSIVSYRNMDMPHNWVPKKTALHGLSSSYKHMPQIGAWLHFETKFTRTAFNTRNVVPLYCLVNRDSQFMDYDTIPSNQTWQWKIPYKWKFLAGKTIYKWRFFQQATW